MKHFKTAQPNDGSLFEAVYTDCSADTISKAIEDSFTMDGYSLKSGSLGDRTYVKGNRVARILLGAFYKYFEFHVGVKELEDNSVKVAVRKTTSGMSGGIIGVNQVKKELTRIETVITQI